MGGVGEGNGRGDVRHVQRVCVGQSSVETSVHHCMYTVNTC